MTAAQKNEKRKHAEWFFEKTIDYIDYNAYNNTVSGNLSSPKHSKFINETKSVLADENKRFRTWSLQEIDKPVIGRVGRNVTLKPSAPSNVDKPSIFRDLPFNSSIKQGGGFQSYSSNLVRKKNLKSVVQENKEQRKLDVSIRRWNRKVDHSSGGILKNKKEYKEEQDEEEFEYDDTPDFSALTMHGSTSHMKLFNKTFANVQTSKYDPEKED